MELKTHVISLRRLPKGTCISYGRTYTWAGQLGGG